MVCIISPSDFQEEYPMTFQLGIVTTDGVILASDCLLTNTKGIRLAYQSPKITVYKELGFAHCSSGDAFCETFTGIVRQEIEKKTIDFAEGEPIEVTRSHLALLTSSIRLCRRRQKRR